jgi:hypothetical protein
MALTSVGLRLAELYEGCIPSDATAGPSAAIL